MKKAVMALEKTLGYAAAEALVCDLENYRIALIASRAASYTLNQEDALNKVLGSEAGALVMDQLVRILERE